MNVAGLRRTITVGLLAMAVSATAWADLKAFNAAVKTGDYRAAATAAEETWKTWDKADPDTALLAREFGFAALVAGRNELARDFGKFLVEQGAALAKQDDQPLTSAVLYRAADFKVRNGADQRNALRTALNGRLGAPGVDMTSVLSWDLLYTADWDAGDWDNASAAARSAAEFYGRNRTLLARQRKAELQVASVEFAKARGRSTQSRNDLFSLVADVHDRVVNDINTSTSRSMQAELWPVKWKAEAWAIAVESYVNSTYQQIGSNFNTSLKPRALLQPTYAQHPESSPLPVCAGSFDGKRLIYPDNKKFRGVGSMIVRLETAPDGTVTDVEILGAIPDENFVEGLVATMETWTYKAGSEVAPGSCRLDSKNLLYRVSFRIG